MSGTAVADTAETAAVVDIPTVNTVAAGTVIVDIPAADTADQAVVADKVVVVDTDYCSDPLTLPPI